MRDRDDTHYDDERYEYEDRGDERFESRTRGHTGPDHDERQPQSDPFRGSRQMYDMEPDERFFDQPRRYEGDYPRARMGGPYRYGAGRRERSHERSRRRRIDIGDYTGVGSAEGYTGFGGPGWQSGGYGDPGFRTSSSNRRHHRADHSIGTDLPRDDTGLDRSLSWSGKGDTDEHLSRRDTRGRRYGGPGPYAGRGPRNYERSAERIREDVCDRLTRHGAIDATDVEIEVNGAEVTLRGSVNDRYAKRAAEDVAEAVPGVREVYNNLRSS